MPVWVCAVQSLHARAYLRQGAAAHSLQDHAFVDGWPVPYGVLNFVHCGDVPALLERSLLQDCKQLLVFSFAETNERLPRWLFRQFVDHLKAEDPYEEVADNLVLASFMSIRMRIVGMALNHPVVCSDWWGEIAEQELRAAGVPYEDWTPELMAQMNDGVVRVVKNT
eukprot:1183752-Pleurochrysis_carterae.AAC.2